VARNNDEGQGVSTASLTPHEVVVTIVGKDGELVRETFCHVAAKQPSPAGLVLLNQDGQVIGFYTYDRLVSAVAKGLDQPQSKLTLVNSVVPFPGIH
jgi:hypothetical protein